MGDKASVTHNLLIHTAVVQRKKRRRSELQRQKKPDKLQKSEFKKLASSRVKKKVKNTPIYFKSSV